MTDAVKMATRENLEALEAYVPRLVRERLARDPSPLTKPVIEHFSAAVLFADMSGFTPLAEELARQGAVGAERLKEVLDICFGKLVELANAFGGDVIKFPGDGALILWRAQQDGADEDLARAVRLASKCGLQIQDSLDGLEAIQLESREPIRLRLRVAIGAGPAFAASVGGSEDRWEFVVGGAALGQIAEAARRASPGEVACSPEAWALLETRTAKAAGQGVRILQEIDPALPPPVVERPQLPVEAGAALRQYIPRVIQTRIDAGQAGWLAEFRYVTVWFANVPAADLAPGGAVDLLQTIAATLQKAAHRFGGGVNELVVDDKGLTLVAGWGQSLATHEDDAARACQAAMQAQRELREQGVECGMGIGSGTAFLATRGGPSRAEYAIIGDVVNLAARLMSAAMSDTGSGTVLCDAATRSRSRRRMVFESLPPVRLKGKAEPVAVFRPLSRKERQVPGRQPFFGRQAEQAQLAARLDALAHRGEGGVVVLMGQAGIGKSRMIGDLMERTQALTVRSWLGSAEEIERSSPYYAWRNILASVVRPEQLDPRLLEFMRSWSGVVPLDVPEGQADLTAEVRAERTRDLLVEVLRAAIGATPTMIVLEDAHWLDSASWALAEALHRAVPALLLVISSRPLGSEQMPAELRKILKSPDAVRLDLTTLTPEESVALVSYRLDVDSLPEAVTHLIWQKAEGHPFFIEQFAFALRDQGVIRVVDGECVLVGDATKLSSSLLPETIQAIVRGRIDRLAPEQQLTLKVASVLGRAFRIEELELMHPLHPDAASLGRQLDLAIELELMRLPGQEGSYTFQHAITQEVAYSMLSFAQRRQLHRAVAEWLESRPSAELADIYPLLAHHWSETEDTLKALDYLEKAGEAAIAAFANREAIGFFRRALAVAGAKGQDLPQKELTFRRAHWHRRIGEALGYSGDSQGCFSESSRCLDVLGLPLIPARSGKGRTMGRHIAAQVVHLTFPSRFVERDPYRRACFAEAAEAAGRCGLALYGSRDMQTLLLASLAAVTWAQKAEQQSVMSLGVAGTTLAAFRLKKLANRCFALARATTLESKQFQQLAWLAAMETQNLLANGKLAACEKMLMDSFPLVKSSGDREAISLILSALSIVSHMFGRYDEMRARCVAALEVLGNEPYRSAPYVHYLVAQAEFSLSRPREARAVMEECRRKASEVTKPDDVLPMYFTALEAGLFTRMMDWATAQPLLEQGVAYGVPATAPPTWCPDYLMDACISMWEHLAASGGQTAAIARQTGRVLRAIRFRAWIHPLHQGTYLRACGRVAWLKGNREKAMKFWRQGLKASEKLSRFFEQGLCHYEIGRRSPAGSTDRRSHLEAARLIFAQCKTTYNLDQVDALLADRGDA